ncbi:hypothetical protein Tco_1349885, partial [Tanacetum coccineum]
MQISRTTLSSILLEEVYVSQPNRFFDLDYHDHVYKLDKALYVLKQALSVIRVAVKLSHITEVYQSRDRSDSLHQENRLPRHKEKHIKKWSISGCETSQQVFQETKMMSTTEAEYVSSSGCYAQFLWMRTQRTDYGYFFDKVLIYYDSKSAIAISCNQTEYQLADLFTKAFPLEIFEYLIQRL